MIEIKRRDGSVTKGYPLTQAQRLMYFVFNSYGKNPAMLNIGAGCFWQGEIDYPLLVRSLQEAIGRTDTMRMRFTPDKQFGMLQYLADEPGFEIEELDFRDKTEEEAYAYFKDRTRAAVPLFDAPLSAVAVAKLPAGYGGFYCRLHHLAFDGYAAKAFIADAMAIYVHYRTGAPYPKPTARYIDAMLQELAYLDSDARKADRAYWMQRFSTEPEPIFNDYMLDNRLLRQRKENNDPNQRYLLLYESEHPESRVMHFDVGAEETQRVLDMCRRRELSVPSVLMLALRTALSAFNDRQEDVSFKFMINRRGTLLQKRSGGNRWHFYTLRTRLPGSLSFAEAAKEVEREQTAVFRHCAFDTLEMYHIKHMAMHMDRLEQTYDAMSFSYHAPLEVPFENEEVKKTAKGVWYTGDISAQNLYLTVKHRLNDNGFEIFLEYRINEKPQRDLTVFRETMLKALSLGTDDPDAPLDAILDALIPAVEAARAEQKQED